MSVWNVYCIYNDRETNKQFMNIQTDNKTERRSVWYFFSGRTTGGDARELEETSKSGQNASSCLFHAFPNQYAIYRVGQLK